MYDTLIFAVAAEIANAEPWLTFDRALARAVAFLDEERA